MEVLDMMFKKARHFSQVGDWDAANNGFDEIIKKEKVSTGNFTFHSFKAIHSLTHLLTYLLTHSLTHSLREKN